MLYEVITGAPASAEAPDRIIQFVTRLREHESRESRLLMDSLAKH